VLARLDDTDWAVRRQLAATLGELPPADRIDQLATMLERHGDDPVVVDAAISGLRGQETDMLTRLLRDTTETPQLSAAMTMLAGTVVRGGRDVNVQTVLQWTADTQRPAWQRSALLNGAEVALLNAPMPPATRTARAAAPARGQTAPAAGPPCPTCPGARSGPGGAPAFPERPAGTPAPTAPAPARPVGPLLRLTREPSLAALADSGDPLASRIAAVLARIEWPGKPGASAPVAPLTAEEERRFDAGHEIYTNICQACHQQDGRGSSGVAASLVGSTLALGPADVTARILLNGKEGTIGLMPALGSTLSDDQIAAVLTYIRREWGQDGSPVEPATVTRTRAATATRTRPWTNDELLKLSAPAGATEGRQ
jgi:mono/diheme cytochrome c family protein